MDAEKFQEIIDIDIRPVIKEISKKKRSRKKASEEELFVDGLTPYFNGWRETVIEYHENRVHSEEKFPTVLFKNVAPNQGQEELDYIRDTHQSITSDVFLEFANTVKRGLINGNIEYQKEDNSDAKDFKEYIDEKIPQYKSLYEYMKSLVDQKLTDANAVLAINYKAQVDEDGIIEGRISPFPEIYNSQNVVYIDPDDSIIVLAHEKSLVKVGSQNQRKGLIFNGYAKDFYFVATQVGRKSDYKFEFTEFDHELGWVPAMRLMGSPRLVDNRLYYSSPFHRAVFNLNLALLDNANLLLIKRKVGYPTRVFHSQKCRHQHNGSVCDEGVIRWSDGEGHHESQCPACNGSGQVQIFGPLSELHINVDEDSEKNPIKANDAMAYISPDIAIPEFLRKEIDQFITKALEVLHLKAEPRGSGNITATEKNIDLKATEGFIKPISDQVWHLYAFLLKTIGSLYLGQEAYDKVSPKVIPAKEFDIIGYDDYIEQLAEARKNDLPGYIIQTIIYNLMRSLNYSDSFSERVFDLIQYADRLWSMSSKDVALSLSRGTASKWEAILHESALAFIFEIVESEESFFDKDLEQQKIILIDKAKSVETAISANQEIELPNPLNLEE
jgi:hypothetical protein